MDQPNPFGRPNDTVTPTALPYSVTFTSPYTSSDWPPRVVVSDHYITTGRAGSEMPGPADQITAFSTSYDVLVEGRVTGSPSLLVADYGQGRVVIQTDNSDYGSLNGDISDEVFIRMIEWVSTNAE